MPPLHPFRIAVICSTALIAPVWIGCSAQTEPTATTDAGQKRAHAAPATKGAATTVPTPPVPAFVRAAPRSADALATLAEGQKVGAPGAPLVDPLALNAFFSSLDNAAQKRGRSRIVVFGNSLIISDRIVDVWRKRLKERFGDAGRGFLLADRMANYGSKDRTGDNARGFTAFNVSWGPKTKYPQGVSVALHVGRRGARTSWALHEASTARLFWLDHKRAPELQVVVDGAPPRIVIPRHDGQARVTQFDLLRGATTMSLETSGSSAVLYGVSVEKSAPGIILDNLSAIGADSSRFLRADVDVFTAQLSALSPNLVTLLLGGNEVKRVAWGGSNLKRVRRDLKAFLARVREVVPHAACLVTGPLENVYGAQPTAKKNQRVVKRPWRMRPQTLQVAAIMKEEAHAAGCAYFDTFSALGGEGALRRLHQNGMLNRDMIHPRGRGLDLIGDLISDAVLDAYEAAAPAPLGDVAAHHQVPPTPGRVPAKNGPGSQQGI